MHNVDKLNRILADTFNHEVDLSEMSTDSLNRMLNTTQAKMMAIKETDLKYWENSQYNKLGLIQHQLKTFISEIAPARADGKAMKPKSESVVMENDLEQAEVMLAAQELVDELQKMVEDLAEMQVQKLMPIVDAMKEQVGFEQAEAYNNSADGALGQLLDQAKGAKEALENATLVARGEQPAMPAPTDMAMDAPAEEPMDMEASDEFDGDDAAAGEDNSIGRELKGESALADMEGKALAEKKFLESKDKLFKMVESGKMTQEHFINVISEFQGRPGELDLSKIGQRPKDGIGSIYDPSKYKKKQPAIDPYDPNELGPADQNPGAQPPRMAPKPKLDIYDPNKYPKGRFDDPKFQNLDKDAYRTRPDVPIGDLRPSKPKTRPDGAPFNRFAPPPTGPGGDEALPRAPKKINPPQGRRFTPSGPPKMTIVKNPRPMQFSKVAQQKIAKIGNTPKG